MLNIRLLLPSLWSTYGVPMEYLWSTYGVPMEYLWSTYGVPMEYLWSTYGPSLSCRLIRIFYKGFINKRKLVITLFSSLFHTIKEGVLMIGGPSVCRSYPPTYFRKSNINVKREVVRYIT